MQEKLRREILELIKKMKQDERKINGKQETETVEDIRYIQNAIEIDGKSTNIICMALSKGKDETSYRYYINNELVCIVDPNVSREPIFTNSRIKEQEVSMEKLRLLIQNPEKYGKEEVSLGQELDENEKLIIKIAGELGLSKDEIKALGLLNAKQKVAKKEEKKQKNEAEQEDKKVFEDDINVKQNLDVNVKVDEMKTLGQTLKVSSKCENIAVIETYQLDKVNGDASGSTRYSFVAVNNDGTVELIGGLEEDHSVGSNSTQQTYKVEHDGNVEENTVLSRYTISGTDATLSVRNGDMGQIEVYYSPDKSKNGNESLDKQLQTDNVLWRTSTEMRNIAGYYDKDGDEYKVDNAIERAEGASIEDDDNTEYKDLDNDTETKSDNEQEIKIDTPIDLEDGSTTTIRKEAEKAKVSPEEFLNKYNEALGETQEEKIESVHEEIEAEYGGGGRDRRR